MSTDGEEWRESTLIRNLFVSSIGRVRRFGVATHRRGWYEYYGTDDGRGYRCTSNYDWPRKLFKIHRLVATAFIPNPDGHAMINHINAIKTDNRVENLEWCSHSHNIRHAFSMGIMGDQRGDRNGNSVLKPDQVIYIFKASHSGVPFASLAARFGVTPGMIDHIHNRRNWCHITDAL